MDTGGARRGGVFDGSVDGSVFHLPDSLRTQRDEGPVGRRGHPRRPKGSPGLGTDREKEDEDKRTQKEINSNF